jgi:hypothetical protein
LLGIVGTYYGSKNLADSRRDIQALQEMDGNTFSYYQVMRIIAYGHYRNDLFRLGKHVTVLVIGVIADLLPSPAQNTPVSPSGIVVTVGLFSIVLLINMASALDRRQREALEGMSEHETR